MTSRRGFFQIVLALATGATVDVERLLWTPGKKLISIPKVIRPPFVRPPILPPHTAMQVVYDAAHLNGLILPGQALSEADADFALRTLNQMLDSWVRRPVSLLPKGYLRAATYNLAAEIAPAYAIPPDPVVHAIAHQSREALVSPQPV